MIRNMIEELHRYKSVNNSTSLVTLYVPSNARFVDVTKMISSEMAKTQNIKSRITKNDVYDSLQSILSKLKSFTQIPNNGLVLFAGKTEEKDVSMAIEPPKPVDRFFYRCDNQFFLDILISSINDDSPPYGIIIISGSNTTLYTIRGTEINQDASTDVDLPNKHGRGGQSQLRFSRLAEEARFNYISKVIEMILANYDNKIPIIIGGVANLKDKLVSRLTEYANSPKIIKVLDIQYNKKRGLYEVLRNCEDIISSIKVEKERKSIYEFFQSLEKDDDYSVYGEKNLTRCLNEGLLKILIVHEDIIVDYEYIENVCKNSNTELVIISSFLEEALQIKQGFGGKVGLLRYPVQFFDDDDSENDEIED